MNKTFGKLNQINVNEDTEKKGRFTYLSWSHAWKWVQKNSENASFELLEDIVYPDGTREVRCSVTIDGATHTMWLAVTDNNNRAIKNPDARAVGDSRMRCLVKAIALHGLGLYVYAGEGVPDAPGDEPAPKKEPPRKNPDISVHPLEPEVQTFELFNRDGTIRDTFNDENHYTTGYLELLSQAQKAGANADMIDQFKEANKNTIDQLGSNNQTKIQDKTKWARTQASVSK
jgi:hypothetical protein